MKFSFFRQLRKKGKLNNLFTSGEISEEKELLALIPPRQSKILPEASVGESPKRTNESATQYTANAISNISDAADFGCDDDRAEALVSLLRADMDSNKVAKKTDTTSIFVDGLEAELSDNCEEGRNTKTAIEVGVTVKSEDLVVVENLQDENLTKVNKCNNLLLDLVLNSDCSVRLVNVAKNGFADFEINTVEQYIALSEYERAQKFLCLPHFGRKTLSELEELVHKYSKGIPHLKEQDKILPVVVDVAKKIGLPFTSAELFERLKVIPMFPVVERAKVGTRTKNIALRFKDIEVDDSIKSVGAVLENRAEAEKVLKSLPSVGRKSVQEFLVTADNTAAQILFEFGLGSAEINLIVPENSIFEEFCESKTELARVHLDNFDFDNWLSDGLSIQSAMFSLGLSFDENATIANKTEGLLIATLEQRSLEILKLRYGLGISRCTLEKVGQQFGLTRERVRQLEAKALQRLQSQAHLVIINSILGEEKCTVKECFGFENDYVAFDFGMEKVKSLSPYIRLLAVLYFGSLEGYMSNLFQPVESEGELLGWLLDESYSLENAQEELHALNSVNTGVRRRIISVLEIGPWPISLETLADACPDIPVERLRASLDKNFSAHEINGVLQFRDKLPAKTRAIISLRALGHPAHLNDIRASHNRVFGEDQTEHALGAILARLEEALITDRGTYGLYEHLGISEEEIIEILDLVYSHIEESQSFVSAKLLYRLAIDKVPDIALKITPYIILGICQDDDRFLSRRGSMIGINDPNFEGAFSSLWDTVHDVFRENRSYSIADVQKHISESRDVLDTSISLILNASERIMRISRTEYELVDSAIGSPEYLNDILTAIELSLIDGNASLPIICNRLSNCKIALNNYTILSVMVQSQHFERKKSLFSLVQASPHVVAYNDLYRQYFDQKLSFQELESSALRADVENCLHLDYRFKEGSSNEAENIETSVIDSILDEFDF